jgi:hypothetical protein
MAGGWKLQAGTIGFLVVSLAPILSLILLSAACSGFQAPLDTPAFPAGELFRIEKQGLGLQVKPIEGTHDNWRLFNENLPENGIGAVWFVLHNRRRDEVDVTAIKWILKLGNENYRPIRAAETLHRFQKYHRTRMITLKAEEDSLKVLRDLEYHANRLESSRPGSGYLFFPIHPTPNASWCRNAVLRLEGIVLSDGRELAIDLPLSHADP